MNYWQKRKKGFSYAFQGIGTLIKETAHAKIHLGSAILVFILGFLLKITTTEWLVLLSVISVVFLAEALNTSLEYLADATHPENHPLIKKAKDVGAAGVLITAIFAAIIGIIIFGPKLLDLLNF